MQKFKLLLKEKQKIAQVLVEISVLCSLFQVPVERQAIRDLTTRTNYMAWFYHGQYGLDELQ